LGSVAARLNATTAQVAIAWVAAQGSDIVPIVGARRRDRFKESLGAFSLTLSADDLKAIEAAVPKGAVAGDLYPPQMAALLKHD
jgi:aryl-alcohol dehydrogenase-like predicted oxidoreductase